MISIYSTRTMLKVIEQMKRARTFLLDMFFPEVKQFDTKEVDIDIVKGKRKLAPFVSPLKEGIVSDRAGYTTRTIKPPYIKLKRPITPAELQNRLPGETVYQGDITPDQRAAILLGKDLADLDDQITRREEHMAATAMQTGVITVVGEGISMTIDFGMAASHKITLTGTDLWSDTDDSNPYGDLTAWRRVIAQDSGLSANVAVFGTDAWDAFMQHPNIQKLLDLRRVDIGAIDPMELPNGVTYQGRLKGLALDLYTYEEWYYDESSSTEKPMIDSKKIVLGSTLAETTRSYGMIQDIKARTNFALPRFPKTWEEEEPSAMWLMLQSAPVVCPHQIDGFLVATVLA